MEERFQELLQDINNPAVNTTGVVGGWIKATQHNHRYDSDHPGHGDMNGGWKWWKYSNEQASLGRIIKYRIGRYVWWVMPNAQFQFENTFLP